MIIKTLAFNLHEPRVTRCGGRLIVDRSRNSQPNQLILSFLPLCPVLASGFWDFFFVTHPAHAGVSFRANSRVTVVESRAFSALMFRKITGGQLSPGRLRQPSSGATYSQFRSRKTSDNSASSPQQSVKY